MTVTNNTMTDFKKELKTLLNQHCIENECSMPDFLLAEMIVNFIQAIGPSVKKTLDWHGCDSICHPSNQMENTILEEEAPHWIKNY